MNLLDKEMLTLLPQHDHLVVHHASIAFYLLSLAVNTDTATSTTGSASAHLDGPDKIA
jgi:hypothetical protein